MGAGEGGERRGRVAKARVGNKKRRGNDICRLAEMGKWLRISLLFR